MRGEYAVFTFFLLTAGTVVGGAGAGLGQEKWLFRGGRGVGVVGARAGRHGVESVVGSGVDMVVALGIIGTVV